MADSKAMQVVHARSELHRVLQQTPGKRSVVMTMGALHDGHMELIRLAKQRSDVVVVTIFVNPLQFGPGEDFAEYPRTLDADIEKLRAEEVDVVFAPNAGEIYPDGEPEVHVKAGRLGELWEGGTRPGHFDGVLTVVAKLLHLVNPDVAVFGQKDAQQLLVIRRMVADLNFPVEIVGGPIVRAPDGLALSSRNAYLEEEDRARALSLWTAISAARENVSLGAEAVRETALAVLSETDELDVDYLALVDPQTLVEVESNYQGEAFLLIAARVGSTRLIDNAVLRLE